MKKFIPLFLFYLSTIYYVDAQIIDITGKGIKGESNPNLPLTEIYSIDSVAVEAIYKSSGFPVKSGVSFYDSDEKKAFYYSPISKRTDVVKFYRTFYTSDSKGVFADVEIENVYSFYEFIYRNSLTFLYKSFFNLETGYMYHNGSKNPFVYKIPIDTSPNSRNIVVKIPITELTNDNRVAIIDITVGQIKKRYSVKTYNYGNSFFLGEYEFSNIPGNVDHILVSIFSPTKVEAQEMGFIDGDSFIISGAIVDVDKYFDGCTLTQGYWKNHSTCKTNGNGPQRDLVWDKIIPNAENSKFFLSDQTYCEVFDTNPGKGGKYYILAHQYIAAELNLNNNANPKDIVHTFNTATRFLETYTPNSVDGNKNLENKCVELGGILDDFNNGRIGPGHCDESTLSIDIENTKNNLSIYPNPSSSNSIIDFVSTEDAKTSIILYNHIGMKVALLFDKETQKGERIKFPFNTNEFNPGIYIMNIINGNSSFSKKILISN